jgi:myo-inositol 2-dehydrogenase/D-chiro-inositol 1-dehydrogenase
MPPNQALPLNGLPMSLNGDINEKIRVAILGCGMMGQEHISYISGYPNLRIDYLCDPHEPSLSKSCKVLHEFYDSSDDLVAPQLPELLQEENDLLARAHQIDLLVIASPNYLHTEALMQWAQHDLTILVEKPVAVSQAQYDELNRLNNDIGTAARIWVAMEYRYIPAIAKLLQLLPDIGELKMVTIRENRYPFLHKIGDWNRDREKTGDTLVEKCCHFWDLFRLITGMEVQTDKLRSLVQRGLNYQDEANQREVPIIDSAYVVLPFDNEGTSHKATVQTVGCLELCMYAEGSRHQEEIIVTGTKVRRYMSTLQSPQCHETHASIFFQCN